jgi:hypothetical protein
MNKDQIPTFSDEWDPHVFESVTKRYPLPFLHECLLFFLGLILKWLAFSFRYTYLQTENKKMASDFHPHGGYINGIWHETSISAILGHLGEDFAPLVSQSKDGEYASRLFNYLGFRAIRGGSSKGGKEARQALKIFFDLGIFCGIAVDGPRGPRREIKPGLISLAKDCQVMLLPMFTLPEKYWMLKKSWDQMKIPKPFTKIVVVYGQPILVPLNTDHASYSHYSELFKLEMDRAHKVALKFFQPNH